MRPDTPFPQSVRSIWWLIWSSQNLCMCLCERWRELQWEVNIRGDQREMLWAVICTVRDRRSNPMAVFSLRPKSIHLPANELGKYSVFTFKVAVVGLFIPSGWLEDAQLWFTSKYWPSGFFGFTISQLMSACQSKPELQSEWCACACVRVDSRLIFLSLTHDVLRPQRGPH